MCTYLFAPGKHLRIEYATETVTLEEGGMKSTIDVLLTNCAESDVERIHMVYPHGVPVLGGTAPRRRGGPALLDATDSWVEDASHFNQFYDRIHRTRLTDGYSVEIEVTDPQHELRAYAGSVRGSRKLVPYDNDDDGELDLLSWALLSRLDWAVCTLIFSKPIEPKESRWLRIVADTGCLEANKHSVVEDFGRRTAAVLTHVFEIAGPDDVRYRLERDLTREPADDTPEVPRMQHARLRDSVINRGLGRLGTQTDIEDWRINLFAYGYREMEEPTATGQILPCSPLVKRARLFRGRHIEVYQWKAGSRNLGSTHRRCDFQIRVRAKPTPFWALLLPITGVVLGLISLIVTILAASC